MTDLFPLLGNLEPKTMVEPVMEFEDLFSELLMEPKEKLIEFTPLEETTEELKFEQEEIINPSLVDVFTEKENLFPEENKTDAQNVFMKNLMMFQEQEFINLFANFQNYLLSTTIQNVTLDQNNINSFVNKN